MSPGADHQRPWLGWLASLRVLARVGAVRVGADGGGRGRSVRGRRWQPGVGLLPGRDRRCIAVVPEEHRQLELEAQPADRGAVRVDRREPPSGCSQRHRIVAHGRRIRARGHHLAPDRLDRLIEQGAQVAAALVERIEERDAGGAVATNEMVDERLDHLGIGQAEQVADGRFVDALRGGRQELVEHRLGVAHAAGRQPGDQVDGGRIRLAAVGGEDAGELALDLGDGQPPDVEALEARQDRRREARRLGRGEHEHDEVGRLLERLEQGVPGVARDLVRLVEDVDLAPELAGRVRQPLAQVPDGVDAAVARGVDLDEVERGALPDRDARRAAVAGVAVLQVGAVDRLGEDPGERGLAGAARPDEQDRVADPVRAHGVAQRLDDRVLADDLGEGLGAPAAIERLVRDGRRHDLLRSGRTREVEVPCTLRRPGRIPCPP